MSYHNVLVTGCAHLGHKNIADFRAHISSTKENTDRFLTEWEEKVHKRTRIICLGDMAFDEYHDGLLRQMPGHKILVKGNHDDLVPTKAQAVTYAEIYGIWRYKKMWMTHAPVHTDTLKYRVKFNAHAHVHDNTIDDPRYFNVGQDQTIRDYGSVFITLEQLKDRMAAVRETHPHFFPDPDAGCAMCAEDSAKGCQQCGFCGKPLYQ